MVTVGVGERKDGLCEARDRASGIRDWRPDSRRWRPRSSVMAQATGPPEPFVAEATTVGTVSQRRSCGARACGYSEPCRWALLADVSADVDFAVDLSRAS